MKRRHDRVCRVHTKKVVPERVTYNTSSDDGLNPARGVLWGFLFGSVMWIGIVIGLVYFARGCVKGSGL